MNAFTNGRPTPVIPLSQGRTFEEEQPARDDVPHAPAMPGVFEKIEALFAATRQLETALSNERNKTKKLKDELGRVQAGYERIIKDAESKNNELSSNEHKFKTALSAYGENEKRLNARLQWLTIEYKKVHKELTQYRGVWSEVLQREREAKLIIRESEKISHRLIDVEAQNKTSMEAAATEKAKREQIERHAKSYQIELQNALVRLHSAEAKFSELSKELQILSQSKRNMDDEIARIEATIKERHQWESLKIREQLRTEAEKKIAQERELLREQAKESEIFKTELEKRMALERERISADVNAQFQAAARAETEKLVDAEKDRLARVRESMQIQIHSLQESLGRANQDVETLRAELTTVKVDRDKLTKANERVQVLERELDSLKEGSHLSTIYSANLNKEVEQLKKENEELRTSSQRRSADKIRDLEAQLAHEREKACELTASAERKIDEIIISERKRAVEMVTKLKPKKKARKPDRAPTLDDIARADSEARLFEAAFNSESERSKSLESALIAEKVRFDQMASTLSAEVERLQTVYPLQDLIMAKELEIKSVKKQLKEVPENDPQRGMAEIALSCLQEQRDRLREILNESERRIDQQRKRITQAMEFNTVLAEPDIIVPIDESPEICQNAPREC